MAQQKVELMGSHRLPPADAQVVGTPAPDETVQVTVVVRRRNPLPTAGTAPPVRREDFAAMYGADPDDLQKVADFAAAEGLTVLSTDAARRTVVLSGTLAALTQVFQADLKLYQQ